MKYILKEMSDMEKPREKLFWLGPQALSDYELLAILLRTGSKNKSVIDLSIDILKQLNTINDLQNITIEELLKHKGIGKTKAIELIATIELGKRISNYNNKIEYIKSTKDAYYYLKGKMSHLEQEHLHAIFLSPNNKIIADKIINIGTSTQTIASPKDVIKWALKMSAYAIIIAHNHPTGVVVPSKQDIDYTLELKTACELVDIKLLDHIIIGKNNYFSFKDKSINNE